MRHQKTRSHELSSIVLFTGLLLAVGCGQEPPDLDEALQELTSCIDGPPCFYDEGTIANTVSGLCLDGYNNEPYMFTCAGQNQQNQNAYQRWVYIRSSLLANFGARKCLDGFGGANGGHPYLFTCNANNPYQRWARVQDTFVNEGNGLCLDGVDGTLGARPFLRECDLSNPYQNWF